LRIQDLRLNIPFSSAKMRRVIHTVSATEGVHCDRRPGSAALDRRLRIGGRWRLCGGDCALRRPRSRAGRGLSTLDAGSLCSLGPGGRSVCPGFG
jgi:hypothetical protein